MGAVPLQPSADFPDDVNSFISNAATSWQLTPKIETFLIYAPSLRNRGLLSAKPAVRPTAGSLFLFSKEGCPNFRDDKHKWARNSDGSLERHVKLKVGKVPTVNVYYAKQDCKGKAGAMPLARRSYWLLHPDKALGQEDLVLVHYLHDKPAAAAAAAAVTSGRTPSRRETRSSRGTALGPASAGSGSHPASLDDSAAEEEVEAKKEGGLGSGPPASAGGLGPRPLPPHSGQGQDHSGRGLLLQVEAKHSEVDERRSALMHGAPEQDTGPGKRPRVDVAGGDDFLRPSSPLLSCFLDELLPDPLSLPTPHPGEGAGGAELMWPPEPAASRSPTPLLSHSLRQGLPGFPLLSIEPGGSGQGDLSWDLSWEPFGHSLGPFVPLEEVPPAPDLSGMSAFEQRLAEEGFSVDSMGEGEAGVPPAAGSVQGEAFSRLSTPSSDGPEVAPVPERLQLAGQAEGAGVSMLDIEGVRNLDSSAPQVFEIRHYTPEEDSVAGGAEMILMSEKPWMDGAQLHGLRASFGGCEVPAELLNPGAVGRRVPPVLRCRVPRALRQEAHQVQLCLLLADGSPLSQTVPFCYTASAPPAPAGSGGATAVPAAAAGGFAAPAQAAPAAAPPAQALRQQAVGPGAAPSGSGSAAFSLSFNSWQGWDWQAAGWEPVPAVRQQLFISVPGRAQQGAVPAPMGEAAAQPDWSRPLQTAAPTAAAAHAGGAGEEAEIQRLLGRFSPGTAAAPAPGRPAVPVRQEAAAALGGAPSTLPSPTVAFPAPAPGRSSLFRSLMRRGRQEEQQLAAKHFDRTFLADRGQEVEGAVPPARAPAPQPESTAAAQGQSLALASSSGSGSSRWLRRQELAALLHSMPASVQAAQPSTPTAPTLRRPPPSLTSSAEGGSHPSQAAWVEVRNLGPVTARVQVAAPSPARMMPDAASPRGRTRLAGTLAGGLDRAMAAISSCFGRASSAHSASANSGVAWPARRHERPLTGQAARPAPCPAAPAPAVGEGRGAAASAVPAPAPAPQLLMSTVHSAPAPAAQAASSLQQASEPVAAAAAAAAAAAEPAAAVAVAWVAAESPAAAGPAAPAPSAPPAPSGLGSALRRRAQWRAGPPAPAAREDQVGAAGPAGPAELEQACVRSFLLVCLALPRSCLWLGYHLLTCLAAAAASSGHRLLQQQPASGEAGAASSYGLPGRPAGHTTSSRDSTEHAPLRATAYPPSTAGGQPLLAPGAARTLTPPQPGLPSHAAIAQPYLVPAPYYYGMIAPQQPPSYYGMIAPQQPPPPSPQHKRQGLLGSRSRSTSAASFDAVAGYHQTMAMAYMPAGYGLPRAVGSDPEMAGWTSTTPMSSSSSNGRARLRDIHTSFASSHSLSSGIEWSLLEINSTLSTSYPSLHSSASMPGHRSAGGSTSMNTTPRSSKPLVQLLVVEENDEVHSEVLDRFKADTEGRDGWQLQDVRGHLYVFCRDQLGSRFVQQALDVADPGLVLEMFEEVEPKLLALMTDVFGNYVVQRFLQLGGAEVRSRVAAVMTAKVFPLSLQMYGCRVVKKALEVFDAAGQLAICKELQGHTQRCVRDQNGNHVIQSIIECVQPSDPAGTIIESIVSKTTLLSCHTFGCRLVQRVLEHCSIDQLRERAVTEVLSNALQLSHDQYGNYVVQHLVSKGTDSARMAVVSKVAPQVMSLAQHKYASNVVEACFKHGSEGQRDLMLRHMTGEVSRRSGVMLNVMKDQFGSYVVLRALEVADEQQRMQLLAAMEPHLASLRKYTYGKHIVARVEGMLAEQAAVQAQNTQLALHEVTARAAAGATASGGAAGGGPVPPLQPENGEVPAPAGPQEAATVAS